MPTEHENPLCEQLSTGISYVLENAENRVSDSPTFELSERDHGSLKRLLTTFFAGISVSMESNDALQINFTNIGADTNNTVAIQAKLNSNEPEHILVADNKSPESNFTKDLDETFIDHTELALNRKSLLFAKAVLKKFPQIFSADTTVSIEIVEALNS